MVFGRGVSRRGAFLRGAVGGDGWLDRAYRYYVAWEFGGAAVALRESELPWPGTDMA